MKEEASKAKPPHYLSFCVKIILVKKKQVVGVLGLLINEKNEFLITLRSEPKEPKAHLGWQIPGGAIEFGERPITALRRELKEEINVEVEIVSLLPLIGSSMWRNSQEETQVILLCYLCKRKRGKIKVDGQETLDYRWIKPADVKKLKYLPLTDDFILAAQAYLDRNK